MTSKDVRNKFLSFFESKGHKIVPSAPIVVKDDPTLMFTNAGMNQFKDFFLGNKIAQNKRVADTQKCLRVSGKHNDLEEVGVDTYHHTMFEMLGNWSFGDYFKEDAIAWAWELLTDVYGLDKSRLYVTVFGGDEADELEVDKEAEEIWKNYISEDRILRFDRKDNFWEMGDTGPCGPCSEIHMDLRPDSEREQLDAKELVNRDHEQVIELWNLVFIQYNRAASGKLNDLPDRHIDTGMGLERVVRAIAGKQSNYDIDLFREAISELESYSGKKYGEQELNDVAFRVIADHIRALVFCISDGQLPSNTGAGYVMRRILRRAVRYGYSFLGFETAFLYKLVPGLSQKFADIFPELKEQTAFLQKVIEQEEISFFRTLTNGLEKINKIIAQKGSDSVINGEVAFELYDTYGFPIDLTELIAQENGMTVDRETFEACLVEQKSRSRADAVRETGDWVVLRADEREEFVGYDIKETEVKITRYRTLKQKGKDVFQLAFNLTPFYAESGGQVGDKGLLMGLSNGEKVKVLDTQKENDLIVHVVNNLPQDPEQHFRASVDMSLQKLTARNHSATHLLHAALKQVLGDHVAQKGSLVEPKRLRFDFSHFAKVSEEELKEIQSIVNKKIREAIELDEKRNIPYTIAVDSGVTALFGEKYGDTVRVITFGDDYSKELCGGIHVQNTAEVGQFRVLSESSISAGVRRIEAITSIEADKYVEAELDLLKQLREELGTANLLSTVSTIKSEHSALKKEIEKFRKEQLRDLKKSFLEKVQSKNGISYVFDQLELSSANDAKDLCFQLGQRFESLFCFLAVDVDSKPNLSLYISKNLVDEKGWNAGKIIREFAKEIQGGGGGQDFFAQAGGKNVSGLSQAQDRAKNWLFEQL